MAQLHLPANSPGSTGGQFSETPRSRQTGPLSTTQGADDGGSDYDFLAAIRDSQAPQPRLCPAPYPSAEYDDFYRGRPETPWAGGRMLGFDTETTGPDCTEARMVSFAFVDSAKGRDERVAHKIVNPGCPSSADAIAVHGITDEMAAAGEPEGAAAEGMLTALNYAWANRIPVVGHNVTYDLTVLDRALRRTHGHPLTVAGPVIDSLVMDRMTDKYRKGRRTLTASAALYGIDLLNAHSADSDASTSVGIVRAIGERRPEVAAMTTAELFEAQTQANEKWAANLDSYFRSKGTWTSTVRGEWPVLPTSPAGI